MIRSIPVGLCLLLFGLAGACGRPLPRTCFGPTLGASPDRVRARLSKLGWGERQPKAGAPGLVGLSESRGNYPRGYRSLTVTFRVTRERDGTYSVNDQLRLIFFDKQLMAIERVYPDLSNPSCDVLQKSAPLHVPPRANPWGHLASKRQAELAECGGDLYGAPQISPHYERKPWATSKKKDGAVMRWTDGRTHVAVGWQGTTRHASWTAACVDDRLWRAYQQRVAQSTTLPPCKPGSGGGPYSRKACWTVEDVVYGF